MYKRKYHSVVCLDHNYLVVVGSIREEASRTSEIYDLEANEWQRLPDLNFPRVLSSICAFGRTKVYVFGHSFKEGDWIEALDLETNFDQGWVL